MTQDEEDRISRLEQRVRLLTVLHVIADAGIGLIIVLLAGVIG